MMEVYEVSGKVASEPKSGSLKSGSPWMYFRLKHRVERAGRCFAKYSSVVAYDEWAGELKELSEGDTFTGLVQEYKGKLKIVGVAVEDEPCIDRPSTTEDIPW